MKKSKTRKCIKSKKLQRKLTVSGVSKSERLIFQMLSTFSYVQREHAVADRVGCLQRTATIAHMQHTLQWSCLILTATCGPI